MGEMLSAARRAARPAYRIAGPKSARAILRWERRLHSEIAAARGTDRHPQERAAFIAAIADRKPGRNRRRVEQLAAAPHERRKRLCRVADFLDRRQRRRWGRDKYQQLAIGNIFEDFRQRSRRRRLRVDPMQFADAARRFRVREPGVNQLAVRDAGEVLAVLAFHYSSTFTVAAVLSQIVQDATGVFCVQSAETIGSRTFFVEPVQLIVAEIGNAAVTHSPPTA